MPSGSLAIGRDRQPRSFPVAVPDRDVVHLIWPNDLPAATRAALDRLCRKVTAVGHSASLVQMWVLDDPPAPDLVPAEGLGAGHHLRVPWDGRLDDLESNYRDEIRPSSWRIQGYVPWSSERGKSEVPGTIYDPNLIVLSRVAGRPIGLETTLRLTEALRGAVMKHAPQPVPDWISGHEGPDGPPLQTPHLAFLALPHVGRRHADGRLMGAALAIPRDMPADEVRRGLSGFLYESRGVEPAERTLFGGRSFEWRVALNEGEDDSYSLRPETWTAASPRWGTVTPVVLDRYPKGKTDAQRMAQAEAMIRLACRRASEEGRPLPEPSDVIATAAPPFVGVPHARAFPPFSRPGGANRFHIHALVTFPEAVRGPIFLGAGRYRGYGFLRPIGGEGR